MLPVWTTAPAGPWRLIATVWLVLALVPALAGPDQPDCRPLPHGMGTSCVPLHPQRVVVLGTGELDIALTLGVLPIGVASPHELDADSSYLANRIQSLTQGVAMTRVGTIHAPDLEAIMALNPDLILGSRTRHEAFYPALKRIAPTVLSEHVGVAWQENLALFARVLNREAKARVYLDRYQALVTTTARTYTEAGRPTVSLVRSLKSHIRIYLEDSFAGGLLAQVGMIRPPSQRSEGFALYLRSPEQILRMDADLMLLSRYAPEQGSLIDDWQTGPFWPRLGVVERHRVYSINDDYWMLGIGPLAAEEALKDLNRILRIYRDSLP
jgi:iron complex transport system substrate-binding protein